jgi:transposase
MYSLIVTGKMKNIDPQAWLAGILAGIAAHPVQRLDEWPQVNPHGLSAA